MKTVYAVGIILCCAIMVAWGATALVSQRAQMVSQHRAGAMSFAHDGGHHHAHGHRNQSVLRGSSELIGSTVLFGVVSAAVVIPSVLRRRQKRRL